MQPEQFWKKSSLFLSLSLREKPPWSFKSPSHQPTLLIPADHLRKTDGNQEKVISFPNSQLPNPKQKEAKGKVWWAWQMKAEVIRDCYKDKGTLKLTLDGTENEKEKALQKKKVLKLISHGRNSSLKP